MSRISLLGVLAGLLVQAWLPTVASGAPKGGETYAKVWIAKTPADIDWPSDVYQPYYADPPDLLQLRGDDNWHIHGGRRTDSVTAKFFNCGKMDFVFGLSSSSRWLDAEFFGIALPATRSDSWPTSSWPSERANRSRHRLPRCCHGRGPGDHAARHPVVAHMLLLQGDLVRFPLTASPLPESIEELGRSAGATRFAAEFREAERLEFRSR